MKTYLYTGPNQSVSLKTGTKKNTDGDTVSEFKDFDLLKGHEVDLPDNPLVDNMIEMKILQVAPEKTKTSKTGKGTNNE